MSLRVLDSAKGLLSHWSGLAICISLGPALYAYGTLLAPKSEALLAPESKVSAEASEPVALPLRNVKRLSPAPSAKPAQSADITGSIGTGNKPVATADRPPKVPGIRIASLGAGTPPLRTHGPDTGWAYAFRPSPNAKAVQPAANRPAVPPAAMKWRKARAARLPRYRRGNFRLMIGVYPAW